MTELDELKVAAAEVEKQRMLIEQEMQYRGNMGRLWQNGMCKAWPAYTAAVDRQAKLRQKYGV